MERIGAVVSGLTNLQNRVSGLLVGKSRDEINVILEDEIELLMHAFVKRGRYTSTDADEILAELGGKTNRQKRLEKLYAVLPLNQYGKSKAKESTDG